MHRGLYASAAGMMIQDIRHGAISNNLANLSTAGYRRQITSFESFANELDRQQSGYLRANVSFDVQNGAIQKTGNCCDLAIQGDGYFAIQDADGEAYTRNGAFSLNTDNQLSTTDGRAVLGEQGPITITEADWKIDQQGQVIINSKIAHKLKLVAFDRASAIAKGNSRWSTPNAKPLTTEQRNKIQVDQGVIEGSNVNSIAEMISLISATRQFEANQRCFLAQDSVLDRTVNEIARV